MRLPLLEEHLYGVGLGKCNQGTMRKRFENWKNMQKFNILNLEYVDVRILVWKNENS